MRALSLPGIAHILRPPNRPAMSTVVPRPPKLPRHIGPYRVLGQLGDRKSVV